MSPITVLLVVPSQQWLNSTLILGLHFFLLSEETTVADSLAFGFVHEKKRWCKSLPLDSFCLHSSRCPQGRLLTCLPMKRLFVVKLTHTVDVSHRKIINKYLMWVVYTATVKNNHVSCQAWILAVTLTWAEIYVCVHLVDDPWLQEGRT